MVWIEPIAIVQPGAATASETRSIRGSWPVAARNFSNPAREIEVVMVFTRG
jgi:hypothetical protein